jgi:adenosylcobinamide-GDP ribazoletransferase
MSAAWHDGPELRAFFTAVQFLTRLPVPGGEARDLSTFRDDIRQGLQYFPLIGAGLGLLTALALVTFDIVFPFAVAVLLTLALEARLTGAFHDDAVADFCDAFGGGWTREEVLAILKDSRIGSYGALGLGFAVAMRAVGLISLQEAWQAAAVLIISGAAGRFMILLVMAMVPPVPQREGLAKDVGQIVETTGLARALMWVAPVLILALWLDWTGFVLAVIASAAFLFWFQNFLMRRIGGVTGDCLGFAAYAVMILTTLAYAREPM